jgi:hypothetical protein
MDPQESADRQPPGRIANQLSDNEMPSVVDIGGFTKCETEFTLHPLKAFNDAVPNQEAWKAETRW